MLEFCSLHISKSKVHINYLNLKQPAALQQLPEIRTDRSIFSIVQQAY